MNDFYLEISCAEEREEEIAARLFLTKSRGSTSDEVSAGTILITAYFDSAQDRDEAAAMFDDVEVRAGEREPVDWLAQYQQLLHPIFIGESFVVAPDAKLIPPETRRHALVIPQEQAFGTGSHETTSLCIELLETLPLFGARGLDIGAGSGILALAMLRLGAAKAIAFDNDVDAYAALRENRERNGIDPARMPLFIGSLDGLRTHPTFDIVTMNIIPEVILPLMGEIVKHAGGTLILSGILTTRRDDVVAACPLPLRDERAKGEWWAGAFSASATPRS